MLFPITEKPKFVVIMGHDVEIVFKKNLKAYGYFYGDKDLIEIRDCKNWKMSLIHELIHGIFYYSGHSFNMKDDYEEALVRALENGIKSLKFAI